MRFEKELRHHKSLIRKMVKDEDESLIIFNSKLSKELSLVYANYKCEKCGEEDEIQYHHLITKDVKTFTDFWKYLSQRYYWGNILVLCRKCHCDFHGFNYNSFDSPKLCIQKEYIEKMRKKYSSDGVLI